MSDKGETSRKGSSRSRRERRDSQDTTNMSMKVNVMYRGIVYRVRGIKVLCSVITAVILLLVAIVGLGVWMLVSAYGEEKADSKADSHVSVGNRTTLPMPQDLDGRGSEDLSTVLSIDFNAPSVTLDELSLAASIPISHGNDRMDFVVDEYPSEETYYSEEIPFNEAIGHFQGVTPSKEPRPSSRAPGPDPPFGLFNGMINIDDTRVTNTTEHITPTREPVDQSSYESYVPSDSAIEYSNFKPISVPTPVDYQSSGINTPLQGFIRNSNGETYPGNGGHPFIQLNYQPSLPDNIPRDIDPKLIGAEIPYPFPPSLTPAPPPVRLPNLRPGRRRNNPRYPRPGLQRSPPGVRRGRPRLTVPPTYYQRPLIPERVPQIYDQYFTQKQGEQSAEEPISEHPSIVQEVHSESQENPVFPISPDPSILDQYKDAGFSLPPGFVMPNDTKGIQISGVDVQGRRPLPGSYLKDMMHYYNKHERHNHPSPTAGTEESEYSERTGLTAQNSTSSTIMPRPDQNHDNNQDNTDEVFDHFWNVYNSNRGPPAQHDDRGPVPEETMGWGHTENSHTFPNPHIRGLGPNGQGYPIRIRPDAENPDRILALDPNLHHQEILKRTSPVPNHHRPILGPLHNIYQYSQKLATTLLSFPSNLFSQIDDSRAEHMRNEVKLLEDYNKVFQQSNLSSSDMLPDMFDNGPDRNERLMILDTEKIKGLNPFELSLITWTFLDFWEFLIEKVGTLSKEDLHNLELRLEKLRRQKDHRMAKSIVDVTIDRFAEDAAKDKELVTEVMAMTEEYMKTASDPSITGHSPGGSAVQGRMWDPLGIFSNEQRVQFMKFAIKVVFKFGRVYLRKAYALDCMMLLFCKDLNSNSKKDGMDGMAAKVKSVGLKVLTEKETRHMDTMGEVWRALTAWETLQCEEMFPRCDGPKALEIVNDVALGARK